MIIRSLSKKLLPEILQKPLRDLSSYWSLRQEKQGKGRELESFLWEAQWWGREKTEAWQLKRLQKTLRRAYEKVPGYCLLYREAGVKPEDIRSLSDVNKLPFTTKELLRDNLKDFTARDVPLWRRKHVTTGGSSGTPFGFYHSSVNSWMESAFMHCGWRWAGWKPQDRTAVLRGTFSGKRDEIGQVNRAQQQLLLSLYHLNPLSYPRYRAMLLNYSPLHLHAYPSTATLLADLVLENRDESVFHFKTLLLGSENVFPSQREKLRAAFPGARIFSWYGHTEQAVLAPACESSDQYHAWPFYGLTEVVDEQGLGVEEDSVGELVGTSFWSEATPFIRYKTEDLALRGADRCPECGRNFLMIKRVDGRKQDFVVVADGGLVSLTGLIFAQHFEAFSRVRSIQLQQDEIGVVLVRVLPGSGFSEQDGQEIEKKMVSACGGKLRVRVLPVDFLPRTSRGKHLFLVQNLKLPGAREQGAT